MNIDVKSFDYSLIHIGREEPQIFEGKPDFEYVDVEFNYKSATHAKGPVIVVFSKVRIPTEGRKGVKVYLSQSHYLIPEEQHIVHMEDGLNDIDNVVLAELTMKHFGIETQFIFNETGGFIIQTQSFYSVLSRLDQLGNELNN